MTLIQFFFEKKQTHLYTFLNPYSYLLARKNIELFGNFNIYIDGIFFVKLLNLFGYREIKRRSFDMTSLAPVIFRKAIDENKTIFFIGSKEHEIQQAVDRIRKEFSQLKIKGYRNGYFKGNEIECFVKQVIDENPDFLVCGMGTPLQEEFLWKVYQEGWRGVGFTCGGFLHQTARKLNYYPDWIERLQMRWLYRIYDEPKLLKRYLIYYPIGILLFLYDFFKEKLWGSLKVKS